VGVKFLLEESMKISRVSEMRAMDRMAIETFGISPELLMENAGHAAYFALRSEFGIGQRYFLIFCGLGNNGGDGFVLARKVHANGGKVQVMIVGDPDKFQGPAKINHDILSRMSIDLCQLKDLEPARNAIADCDIIIDAIFGTGLSRNVEGLYREVIELINASHKPVLSIDIPSGVHGDTGKVMGVAVKADITVTFGLPKLGNVLSPGYELGGKLFVSHISFPPSLHQSDSLKIEINNPHPQDHEANKTMLGKALTIDGDFPASDPPTLSIVSFLPREGFDSHQAAAKPHDPVADNKGDQSRITPQEEKTFGNFSRDNKETVMQLVEEVDMVILGPETSHKEETQELACKVAQKISKPLLIDGKGITAFCETPEILRRRKGPTILTLHPEEMSCITSVSTSEIDEDVINNLQEIAARLNSIIVLKGIQCLIGFPDQRIFINMGRVSGMAIVDSSDVLTSAISGTYCQGTPLDEAVRQGVFIHGIAVDLAAQVIGEDGITAENILDHVPLAVKAYREGLSKALEERMIGLHPI
jgi:hydroxyethylthiazole kinase-like uncharacterized protein yjeF